MANNNKTYTLEDALKDLGKDIDQFTEALTKEARQLIPLLAAQTHGLVVEKATHKLKARRKQYLDAVNIKQISVDENNEVWAVTLDKSAGWIEDGTPAGERIDQILNGGKPAKVAKDGSRYKIIPFKYNKAPSSSSSADLKLARYVQNQLKLQGLDKTINDSNGNPKLGKAASVKITDSNQPVGKGNRPILSGLTIYQQEKKNKAGEVTGIKRSVMTFRVISSKQKNSGLWEWKEQKGVHIFDEVEKEIDVLFDKLVRELIAKT